MMQNHWASHLNPLLLAFQQMQNDPFVYSAKQTIVADATTSDIQDIYLDLPAAKYLITFGTIATINYTVAYTSAQLNVALFDMSNTQIQDGSFCGIPLNSATQGSNSIGLQQFITWPGGRIKLRGRIAVTGGTITNRILERAFIRATKQIVY